MNGKLQKYPCPCRGPQEGGMEAEEEEEEGYSKLTQEEEEEEEEG